MSHSALMPRRWSHVELGREQAAPVTRAIMLIGFHKRGPLGGRDGLRSPCFIVAGGRRDGRSGGRNAQVAVEASLAGPEQPCSEYWRPTARWLCIEVFDRPSLRPPAAGYNSSGGTRAAYSRPALEVLVTNMPTAGKVAAFRSSTIWLLPDLVVATTPGPLPFRAWRKWNRTTA